MASPQLSRRISALQESYKHTTSLIAELQNFPGSSGPTDDLDDQRLELANSCHQSLKDAEESLEILRQEFEDTAPPATRTRQSQSTTDHDRYATTIARLGEDVRSLRTSFRRAQLQSKKNLDSRRQQEREQLFANRRNAPAAQPETKRLTQDEMATNAAEDVTRALRRTHAMMSSSLQQSQFAQQTLEESQEQLRELSQSYTGTTDMLTKSRGLVKALVTSQKSDTWYLQTTVYILLVTLAWLFFRRLLYGPLWWFVYMPLSWTWWSAKLLVAGSGETGKSLTTSVDLAGSGMKMSAAAPQSAAILSPEIEIELPPGPEMIEEVKQMIKQAGEPHTAMEDDRPRNPKKRMMELEKEEARIRDEL